jgi:hypothetical protein
VAWPRLAGFQIECGLPVERALQDRAQAGIGAGLQLQRTLTGRFEPLVGIGLGQAQDPEASAIAHLRMRLAGEDGTDDFGCGGAHGFAPVNQAGRRPLDVSLVALRHVLKNGRVAVGCRAAGMGSDTLAAMEYFDSGCGVTGIELLTGELIRNAVVVPVNLNVIIDVGPDCFPFGHHVALGRQGLKSGSIDAFKQRSSRAFTFAERPLIQAFQQFLNRLIELGNSEELAMPERG